MGMARFLKNLYNEHFNSMSCWNIAKVYGAAGAALGAKFWEAGENSDRGPTQLHLLQCMVIHRFKFFLTEKHTHTFRAPDQLEKVPAKLYLGLTESHPGAAYASEFMEVAVPRFFCRTLEALNKAREAAHRQELEYQSRRRRIIGKKYKSRTFPPALRALILERDQHRCCLCNRDNAVLLPLGLHLEIDHIDSWEDGGETSYDNGQTLCSECNIAKHHTKQISLAAFRLKAANS